MKLRTEIKLEPQQKDLLDYNSKVFLLGSCFSENIGQKLNYFKFETSINPFGTLFSPTAIERVLKHTVEKHTQNINSIIQQGELYHSLHHHSCLSALHPQETVNKIHKAQQETLIQLKKASHIIITLGTSWVYQYLKTGDWVANCHKIPSNEFNRELLSVNKIVDVLQKSIEHIRSVNKNAQIIFTVSPVRHTKDGLVENSLSKAHLLSAVHQTIKNTANKSVSYFGSYEIMMDDLRDYRFYEADMIHPNHTAIHYIWDKFCESWITKESQQYFKRIAGIQQGLTHKPFNEDSEAHQLFLKKLTSKKTELENLLNIQF